MDQKIIPEGSKDLAVVAVVSVIILILLISIKSYSGLPVCPSFNDKKILTAVENYLKPKYDQFKINYPSYSSAEEVSESLMTIPQRGCDNGVATYYLRVNVSTGSIVLQIDGSDSGFVVNETNLFPKQV